MTTLAIKSWTCGPSGNSTWLMPPGPDLRPDQRPCSVVEAKPAQLLRIPLPVLGDLDAQVEIHPGAQQRLDLLPGPGADLLEPRALGADDDGLLAGALHVHQGVHVDEVIAPFPRRHLVHHHGDRVRQL